MYGWLKKPDVWIDVVLALLFIALWCYVVYLVLSGLLFSLRVSDMLIIVVATGMCTGTLIWYYRVNLKNLLGIP